MVAISSTECAFAALRSDGSVVTWGEAGCSLLLKKSVFKPVSLTLKKNSVCLFVCLFVFAKLYIGMSFEKEKNLVFLPYFPPIFLCTHWFVS